MRQQEVAEWKANPVIHPEKCRLKGFFWGPVGCKRAMHASFFLKQAVFVACMPRFPPPPRKYII
jgi:hypothetical protein